jgi:hypothetical protein
MWPAYAIPEGSVSINDHYGLTSTQTMSEDFLTLTITRQSDNQALLQSIIDDSSNSSSPIYWITEYCNNNNITVTMAITSA